MYFDRFKSFFYWECCERYAVPSVNCFWREEIAGTLRNCSGIKSRELISNIYIWYTKMGIDFISSAVFEIFFLHFNYEFNFILNLLNLHLLQLISYYCVISYSKRASKQKISRKVLMKEQQFSFRFIFI